jgi:hypothetical protein
MSNVIFLGPTMDVAKAQRILEADYRPPAKKGDFLGLATVSEGNHFVGLIDGVFLHDYPPSPIEVYQLLLKKNFTLAGSSSLGALRAVELEKFGMRGIGKVFELYKKGIVFADDEVAVTYAPGDYKLQSEAMVDVRFNIFLARKRGIIGEFCRSLLTKQAKALYFPYRTYETIINICLKKFPSVHKELDNFQKYVNANRTSIKERDAIRLLKFIKAQST